MHFTVIKFSCQCWASKSQNSRYGIQLVSGWFWQIEKLKFLARSWFQKEIMQQKLWEPARQLSQSLSNMQKLKYLVFSVQYFNSTTNVWLSRYFLKLTCLKVTLPQKRNSTIEVNNIYRDAKDRAKTLRRNGVICH